MFLKKLLSVLFGILIAFVLCEIILRIYNPFQSRVRGNEIILKSNYKKKILIDPPIAGLDNKVFFSTNSLGFRGPEKPADWEKALTVLTVGGSTTECSLLSDDSTWSAGLYVKLKKDYPNLWLNNAGIDGCSTYGHIILMRDYVIRLKPDYVLFLVGINDLARNSFKSENGFLINREEAWFRKLLKKSELFTTISNVREALISQKADLDHGKSPGDYVNSEANMADSAGKKILMDQLQTLKPTYLQRIAELHKMCKDNNIVPVFVTQPMFDDEASFTWKMMLVYNDALIEYCKNNQIHCIDLGRSLPKDIRYYYDHIHYTNTGAKAISEILKNELKDIIK